MNQSEPLASCKKTWKRFIRYNASGAGRMVAPSRVRGGEESPDTTGQDGR